MQNHKYTIRLYIISIGKYHHVPSSPFLSVLIHLTLRRDFANFARIGWTLYLFLLEMEAIASNISILYHSGIFGSRIYNNGSLIRNIYVYQKYTNR